MAEADDHISPGGTPPQNENQRQWMLENLRKAREAKAAKAAEKKAEETVVATKKAAGPSSENDGPDLDKVNELIAMYPQVSCDIRHHIGGSWKMTNENYLVETKELLTFTNHLIALEGGGKYSVRVRDPNDLGTLLMPIIKYNINQPPRVRTAAPDAWSVGPVAMPVPDFVPPPPPPLAPTSAPFTPVHQETAPMQPQQPPPGLPPQYRVLPVDQQWALYYAQMSSQAQRGLEPAGQVAMTQVQQLLAEKGRLEASLAGVTARAEADRRALEERIAGVQREQERQLQAERDRANKAEAAAVEARHRADMDALKAASEARMNEIMAELRALKTTPKAEEKKSGFESFAIFIPVILEWLRANNAKDEAERARQFENMKLLMATTKREQTPIEAEMMKSFTEMMKLKNDEKISDAEAKVMMLGAISNFIKEREGDADPWWLPVVTGMIESAKGIGTALIASKTQVPGQQALPEGPPQPTLQGAVEAQGEPVNVSVHEQYERQQWETFMKTDLQAAQMTAMVFQSDKTPAAMHTPEWRMLIFNLHSRKTDPVKLAEIAVNHLENQREFGLLPVNFKAVFETPAPVLELVVKSLPVWAVDQDYAQAFLTAAIEEIVDRETERKRVEREDAEEAAAEAEAEEVEAGEEPGDLPS